MLGSEGNSKLCFPELRAKDSRKKKLTVFPSVLTLSIWLYFKTFTSKVTNNKQRIKTMSHN